MLTFITGNEHKLREARMALPGIQGCAIDLPEIQSLDPREIITAKLEAAQTLVSGAYIVEDTGLSIPCLRGLPGPLVKWFIEALGLEGLANLALERDPAAEALATCTIGFRDQSGTSSFFDATILGTIVEPRGNRAFGWDAIFVPNGHMHTFGEMSPDEKQTVSARARAFAQLANYLNHTESTQ